MFEAVLPVEIEGVGSCIAKAEVNEIPEVENP
jgi:hypothetical protein